MFVIDPRQCTARPVPDLEKVVSRTTEVYIKSNLLLSAGFGFIIFLKNNRQNSQHGIRYTNLLYLIILKRLNHLSVFKGLFDTPNKS